MSNETKIDISGLNKEKLNAFIHYETERIDYTINEYELKELENIGNSSWKELFFAALGIAIPTFVNALVAYKKNTDVNPFTLEIFCNCLFFGISIFALILSGAMWRSQWKKNGDIINKIKNKPQFQINE